MDDSGVNHEQKVKGAEQAGGGKKPKSRAELEGLKHGRAMKRMVEAMEGFAETEDKQALEEARKERDGLLMDLVLTKGEKGETTLLDWCKEVSEKEGDEFGAELGKVDNLVIGLLFDTGEGPKEAAKHLAKMKVFELKEEGSRGKVAETWKQRIEEEVVVWKEYAESCETDKERRERLHKKNVARQAKGELAVAGGGPGDEEEEPEDELEEMTSEEKKKEEEKVGESVKEVGEEAEEIVRRMQAMGEATGKTLDELTKELERVKNEAGGAAGEVRGLTEALAGLRDLISDPEQGLKVGVEELMEKMESFREEVGRTVKKVGKMQDGVRDLDEAMEDGRVTQEAYVEAMDKSAEAVKEFTGYWYKDKATGEDRYQPGLLEIFAETAHAAAKKAQAAWEGQNEDIGGRYSRNGFWSQKEYEALGAQEEGEELQEQYEWHFIVQVDKAIGQLERPDRPFSQAAWQETQQVLQMIYSVKNEELLERLIDRYDRHRRANDWRWLYNRAAGSQDCTSAANLIPPDAMAELLREERYLENDRDEWVVVTDEETGEEKRLFKKYVKQEYRVVDAMVDEFQAMGDVMVQLEEMKRVEGGAMEAWRQKQRDEGRGIEDLEDIYGEDLRDADGSADWRKAYKVAVGRVNDAVMKVVDLKKQGYAVDSIGGVFAGGEVELVDDLTGERKTVWKVGFDRMDFDDVDLVARIEGLVRRDEQGKEMIDEEKGDINRAAASVFAYLGMDVSDGWMMYGGGFFNRREQNLDDYVRDAVRGDKARFPDRWALVQKFKPTPDSRGWMSERGTGMSGGKFRRFKGEFGFETGRQRIAGETTDKWATLDWVRIGHSDEAKTAFEKLSFRKYDVRDRQYSIYHADVLGELDAARLMIVGGGTQSLLALPMPEKLEKMFDADVKWFTGTQEAQRLAVLSQLVEGMADFYQKKDIFMGMPLVEKLDVLDSDGKVVGTRWAMNRSLSERALGIEGLGVAGLDKMFDRFEKYIGPDHTEYLKREYEKFAGFKGTKLVREFRKVWDTLEPQKAVPVALVTLLLQMLATSWQGIETGLAESGLATQQRR